MECLSLFSARPSPPRPPTTTFHFHSAATVFLQLSNEAMFSGSRTGSVTVSGTTTSVTIGTTAICLALWQPEYQAFLGKRGKMEAKKGESSLPTFPSKISSPLAPQEGLILRLALWPPSTRTRSICVVTAMGQIASAMTLFTTGTSQPAVGHCAQWPSCKTTRFI